MKAKSAGEVKLEAKYIILTLIAAAISYLAYYLRFPNSWSVFLMLVFSIILLKNFNSIRGVNVVIYMIIFTALILPLNIFVLNVSIGYKITAFIINLIIINFVANGLKRLRKWGLYLSIIVFALSLINIAVSIFLLVSRFISTLSYYASLASLVSSLAFSLLSICYLIKSKGYFA